MSTSYSVNGRSGHSVLEFPIQEDGKYLFACDYGKENDGPEVVVAVGAGVGGAILHTITSGLGAFFGGSGAGMIVVLAVLIRRERAKNRIKQSGNMQF